MILNFTSVAGSITSPPSAVNSVAAPVCNSNALIARHDSPRRRAKTTTVAEPAEPVITRRVFLGDKSASRIEPDDRRGNADEPDCEVILNHLSDPMRFEFDPLGRSPCLGEFASERRHELLEYRIFARQR